MLTDLGFLAPGQPWPPESERERMDLYHQNRRLFEGKHAEVYKEDLKRIERVIGNFEQVISYPVVLNYQKLMSLKIADLLLGEPPQITAGEADSTEHKAVEAIELASDLLNTAYMTAIDVSRYGDGLFYVRSNGEHGIIDVTQPCCWYPVVMPNNVREIMYHVIATECETYERGRKANYLTVQIHERGRYFERVFGLVTSDNATVLRPVIGSMVSEQVFETGLNDFAIVQVPNIITSDRVTGLDDYADVDSVISELMVRVGQIARILDKHAAPSVQGPQTSLERDPVTGEWRLKMGNFFPRDSRDDPEVAYITWDGQLEANFRHIDKLTNFLYTMSEMGSALFGDMSAAGGQPPSGTALRRLMLAPLAKVNRIRMRFDPALKKAIQLCSQLGGPGVMDLSDTPITITWQDGLPGDPVEEAAIIEKRVGKSTMSQRRALTQFDGMSDAAADQELVRIQEEEEASTPMLPPPFSQNPPPVDPKDDVDG
jgi:hypothetical protein